MNNVIRMNLNVSKDIPARLAALAGGKRRMGEHLEKLILEAEHGTKVIDLAGVVAQLKDRITKLEANQSEQTTNTKDN